MKLIVLILILGFPSLSWGYIDPGSASIFLQVVFAFFIGGLLAFKSKVIAGIKSVYDLIFSKKVSASDEQSDADEK